MDSFKYITDLLSSFFRLQPNLRVRDAYITPPWLHVCDSLLDILRAKMHGSPLRADTLSIRGSSFAAVLGHWRTFGTDLGLHEEALRKAEMEARAAEMKGLVGCSWVKCPFFGGGGGEMQVTVIASLKRMLRCSRCKGVSQTLFFLALAFRRLPSNASTPADFRATS